MPLAKGVGGLQRWFGGNLASKEEFWSREFFFQGRVTQPERKAKIAQPNNSFLLFVFYNLTCRVGDFYCSFLGFLCTCGFGDPQQDASFGTAQS